MSRPESRPEYVAAAIRDEADLFAAAYRAVTGRDLPDTREQPWSEADEELVDRAVATRDPDEPMWKPARRRTR